jgi:hypothetical protein
MDESLESVAEAALLEVAAARSALEAAARAPRRPGAGLTVVARAARRRREQEEQSQRLSRSPGASSPPSRKSTSASSPPSRQWRGGGKAAAADAAAVAGQGGPRSPGSASLRARAESPRSQPKSPKSSTSAKSSMSAKSSKSPGPPLSVASMPQTMHGLRDEVARLRSDLDAALAGSARIRSFFDGVERVNVELQDAVVELARAKEERDAEIERLSLRLRGFGDAEAEAAVDANAYADADADPAAGDVLGGAVGGAGLRSSVASSYPTLASWAPPVDWEDTDPAVGDADASAELSSRPSAASRGLVDAASSPVRPRRRDWGTSTAPRQDGLQPAGAGSGSGSGSGSAAWGWHDRGVVPSPVPGLGPVSPSPAPSRSAAAFSAVSTDQFIRKLRQEMAARQERVQGAVSSSPFALVVPRPAVPQASRAALVEQDPVVRRLEFALGAPPHVSRLRLDSVSGVVEVELSSLDGAKGEVLGGAAAPRGFWPPPPPPLLPLSASRRAPPPPPPAAPGTPARRHGERERPSPGSAGASLGSSSSSARARLERLLESQLELDRSLRRAGLSPSP